MSKILFVSSEAHPLIKTGGLGDVSGSLPAALKRLRQNVTLLLPAYQQVVARAGKLKAVAELYLPGTTAPVRILEGQMPDSKVKLWLVDAPDCFNRDHGPYQGADGRDWPDNARRFTVFCRAAAELALDRAGLGWRPDVVHCHDWQTGLIPALLARDPARPGTVFTIHNLAYQGLFPWETFAGLELPHDLWHMDAMEFYDHFSFIKGGLVFADWITTVSPTYAEEIRRPELGYGLDGLLNHRADRFSGILNGADYDIWNPAADKLIPKPFTTRSFADKAVNKRALQVRFQLPVVDKVPLLGFVGRMVEQKGIDLVLQLVPRLAEREVQMVVLGNGERRYEEALTQLARRFPRHLGMYVGYDEERSHLVEAGSDIFLMPSRFEPCGLNQIYSLRYGTVPVVHRTGGLADTVVDTVPKTLADGTATGFLFDQSTAESLAEATSRALDLYARPQAWQQLALNGMEQDFSWERSARRYLEIYDRVAR
jgi:starch synthase